jgi:hypothetical protein
MPHFTWHYPLTDQSASAVGGLSNTKLQHAGHFKALICWGLCRAGQGGVDNFCEKNFRQFFSVAFGEGAAGFLTERQAQALKMVAKKRSECASSVARPILCQDFDWARPRAQPLTRRGGDLYFCKIFFSEKARHVEVGRCGLPFQHSPFSP